MRIDTVTKDRQALTTGMYRSGFCYAEGVLPAGTYTIIVSTYKPGQVLRVFPYAACGPISLLFVCLPVATLTREEREHLSMWL